ncbi:Gfo/Idh/MocA family protein [Verrucomicrobiota bacterium]
MLKIGLVGVDNGHAVVYSKMLNGVHGTDKLGVPAALTCYWAAEDGRWPELETKHIPDIEALGVKRVISREEMIGQVDGVIVVGDYNDVNLERARPFIEAKIPTFADKILCNELEPAKELVSLAQRCGTPIISHSALRYVPEVLEIKQRKGEIGKALSGVWIGPGDLMNYGMHTVDPALAVFGPGVEWCYNFQDEDKDMAVLTYPDGRAVSLHLRRFGSAEPRWRFSYFAENESGQADISLNDLYANSVREVLRFFAGQRQAPPGSEMLETVAIITAMRVSGKTGQRVNLPDLLKL